MRRAEALLVRRGNALQALYGVVGLAGDAGYCSDVLPVLLGELAQVGDVARQEFGGFREGFVRLGEFFVALGEGFLAFRSALRGAR
jgi:hypothetical protein